MTNYKTQRAIVSILLVMVLVVTGLLTLGILGLIVFGLFNQRGEVSAILPSTYLSLAMVLIYGGVTYVLLHGILAVFDIADNTAMRAPKPSAGTPERRNKQVDHNERTPEANPVILDNPHIPRRR